LSSTSEKDVPVIARILVVDDEPDILLTVQAILEENPGFRVFSYIDSTVALSNFKAGFFDLALLDVRMPKINGFNLYRKIRQIDSEIIIGFLTAYDMTYEDFRRNEIKNLDIKFFILKPIERDNLLRKISDIFYSKASDAIYI